MHLLLENINHEDLKKYLKEFYNYAKKELKIDRAPKLFLKKDKNNADDLFGKTGYYDPDNEEIHLFITDRHAKDVIRSYAHELVHHSQKLEGKNDNIDLSNTHDPAYASKDPKLREMERDAFERGNLIFRDWCDIKKVEKKAMLSEKKNKKNKKTIKQQAAEQAAADMKSRSGSDMKDIEEEQTGNSIAEEKEIPHQELFDEKDRLLGKAFNKREDLVYQELIKRFIKK